MREGVGLFDMTSFGKIRVEGRDACAFLQRLCANDVDVEPGRIVYTQMLNRRGGIESDLTVTRLSETAFLLVVPAATLPARPRLAARPTSARTSPSITDVTAAEAVLASWGRSRAHADAGGQPGRLLQRRPSRSAPRARSRSAWGSPAPTASPTSASSAGSSTSRPTRPPHVFEALDGGRRRRTASRSAACTRSISCRIEKAFRHFGHDITDEDHVLEAGLGFAVKPDKGDFIGRDAVLRRRDEGLSRRLLQFRLRDPEPLLFHNEAIVRDGRIVGIVTSGNYGHHLGAAIGLGYVPCAGESADGGARLDLRDRDRRPALAGARRR